MWKVRTSHSLLLEITVGKFIVSSNAGTFTHFYGVVHISCQLIHFMHIFLYSTPFEKLFLILPIASFLLLALWTMWKTYPQKMWKTQVTPFNVWIMWKTYPPILWKTRISQLALWKVWKTYPQCLGINGSRGKTQKITRLSTITVDNLVENCAEVYVRPLSASIFPRSLPGYRTLPGKWQVNRLPAILAG